MNREEAMHVVSYALLLFSRITYLLHMSSSHYCIAMLVSDADPRPIALISNTLSVVPTSMYIPMSPI